MVKTYYKQTEVIIVIGIPRRKPGRRVNLRRASRERREDTIQLPRQMGVITVASRIERLTDNM